MSRSEYSDDCDYNTLNLYRANVDRAIRGKRGQQFLRDLVKALEELPEKRLIVEKLEIMPGDVYRDYKLVDGKYQLVVQPYPPEQCWVCALGALWRAKDLEKINPEMDTGYVAERLNIADMLAREVVWENDEHFKYYRYSGVDETPEERYDRMLRWARSNIVGDPRAETPQADGHQGLPQSQQT